MKTFLIVLLTVALLAAACFTRPDEQNFRDHLARSRAARAQGDAREPTNFRKAMAEMEAEAFANTCEFKDRLLWVDVQRDGKTIYTGAFAHWFKYATQDGKPAVTSAMNPKAPAVKPAPAKLPEAKTASARKPAKRRTVDTFD